MKLITVVVMWSFALAGCQDKESPFEQLAKVGGAKTAEPEEAKPAVSAFKQRALAELAKITEFKNSMCECRDRACATKVHEAHEAWSDAQPPDHTKADPGEEEEIKGLMKAVFNEQRACLEKAIAPQTPKAKVVAMLGRLTTFKTTICKCAKGDAACATKVMDANMPLLEELEKSTADIAKLAPADAREIGKVLSATVDGYTACMKSSLHGGTETAQEKAATALGRAEAMKDAMCKCKAGDSTCVLAVLETQKQWAAESQAAPSDGSTLSSDEKAAFVKRFDPIMADYKKCLNAALTGAH